jgi:uncharacterized protein
MIDRLLKNRVLELLDRYPAVALLGPRQCGKTTLAQMVAQSINGRYFDLEREQDRLGLDVERETLASGPEVLILPLDEEGPALVRECMSHPRSS